MQGISKERLIELYNDGDKLSELTGWIPECKEFIEALINECTELSPWLTIEQDKETIKQALEYVKFGTYLEGNYLEDGLKRILTKMEELPEPPK